jgi:hypothetical protein
MRRQGACRFVQRVNVDLSAVAGRQPAQWRSTLGCCAVWGARHARRWAPLALAVVLAGCGGGYTKSDFVARADAICASALRQTRSIPPGADLGGYLAAVLAVVQSEATQLRALRRPPDTAGDRATLEQYFAALGQTVSDYRQLAAAAQSGDQQIVASAEASLAASPLESLAARYGLRSCGAPTATVA